MTDCNSPSAPHSMATPGRCEHNRIFPILQGNGSPTGSVRNLLPRIGSVLVKPASAVCNLDCQYCFYLDRQADPYRALPGRIMTPETLERLVDGYLFYSYPNTTIAFQGGEPTLAGLPFFQNVVSLEKRYGRTGQSVSNSLQTNGILLDEAWCELLRDYNFLVGLSLDGPEDAHNAYRVNKNGRGTWARVMEAAELLRRQRVEFNILCVLSKANVASGRELYSFFRKLGIANLQFIPLAEFNPDGSPTDYAISAEDYGRFLCEVFDVWWPERRQVRVRFFDNLAEAAAGRKPANCTLHDSCDSYAVVEYNGDVYPCDFFVEAGWKLGNIMEDSWAEIARRPRRGAFAAKKSEPHPDCAACEYRRICHGGCPKLRHAPARRFEDLDCFCAAYKRIFSKALPRLEEEVKRLGLA
jgi:uncharacterized protein